MYATEGHQWKHQADVNFRFLYFVKTKTEKKNIEEITIYHHQIQMRNVVI